MATAHPDGEHGGLGRAELTTVHAVGQALAIGPFFSAGLVLGLVASVAGFTTPLAVLAGSLGALALGYVVSLYARRYAGAGAIYEYLTHGAHRTVGIFAGGLFFLGTLFLGAGGIYLGLGLLLKGFFASHLSSVDPPWWLCSLVCLAIAFVLNHFGVRLAIRGVLALAAVSAVPIVLLAIVIIAKGGEDGLTLDVFNPSTTSWNDVFHGILFAVTLFIGFEAAASIAEETQEPRRSIPIAVVLTVALSGLLYVIVSYAAAIGFGKAAVDKGAWVGSPSPLGDLAKTYVGSWLSTIIDLVIILDALSLAIAVMVAGGRGFFALARDGLLPRVLSRTSRYGTPVAGNLVCVVFTLALVLWTGYANYAPASLDNLFTTFSITTAAGSLCIEFIYLLLALAAVRMVASMNGQPGQWWRWIAVVGAIATPLLAFYGTLHPFPDYPANRGVFVALACAAIALVWYLVLQATRPATVRNAAAYAAQHEGVPALDEPIVTGHSTTAGADSAPRSAT